MGFFLCKPIKFTKTCLCNSRSQFISSSNIIPTLFSTSVNCTQLYNTQSIHQTAPAVIIMITLLVFFWQGSYGIRLLKWQKGKPSKNLTFFYYYSWPAAWIKSSPLGYFAEDNGYYTISSAWNMFYVSKINCSNNSWRNRLKMLSPKVRKSELRKRSSVLKMDLYWLACIYSNRIYFPEIGEFFEDQ